MLYIRILCLLALAVLTVHKTYSHSRFRLIPGSGEIPPICAPIRYYNSVPPAGHTTPGGDSSFLHTLKAAIAKDPGEPLYYYALGVIYFNSRQFEDAVTAFEQAGDKGYKRDADYYLHLGNACMQMKQVGKAMHYLHHCLELHPKDTVAIQAMAQGSYQGGDYEQAIMYWQQLIDIQPKNAFAMFMLGKSYISHGERKKGEEWCDRATAGL
jgi:tetratricopeptide (TPR) repeat protein